MIKVSILVSFIVLMVGCAANRVNYIIQSEFKPYVYKFEKLSNVSVTVNIKFGGDLGSKAGMCYAFNPNSSDNLISINNKYWDKIGDLGKEQLIFHELGHCVLGLGHNNKIGKVGNWLSVPVSIMYSVHFGDEQFYKDNLGYYYSELLGKSVIWR